MLPDDTLFRVFLSPAQSMSLWSVIFVSAFCQANMIPMCGDPFTYLPTRSASACHQLLVWQLPWNTLSQRAVDLACQLPNSSAWPRCFCTLELSLHPSVHLSIPTVSDIFEGIPMSILLAAHLSRFPLLVSDSMHPQLFGSVSCPARTLSRNFSMNFVCSA